MKPKGNDPELRHAFTAAEHHPQCVVCGNDDFFSLGLKFRPQADGSMRVVFPGGLRFQGYRNMIHGGILAMIIDAAMTHCLFTRGIAGVTADLQLRYLRPVMVHQEVEVTCSIGDQKHQILPLTAEVRQAGKVKVRGEARFWKISSQVG